MLLIAINGTGHVYTTVINNIIKRLQTVHSGVHHGFMGEWGDVGLLPPMICMRNDNMFFIPPMFLVKVLENVVKLHIVYSDNITTH